MAYSTLNKTKWGDCQIKGCKNKNCACSKIGKVLMCLSHYRELKTGQQITKSNERDKQRRQSTTSTQQNQSSKVRSLISSIKNKEVSKGYDSLDRWFKEMMKSCEVKCANCGATSFWLEQNKDLKGKSRWKSCQAHLLPKRHFESIMTHPLNGMVLGSGFSGLCNCHDTWDSNWEKASKMAIWDEFIRRVNIMYPLIPFEERRFIPDIVLKEIKDYEG